MMFLESLNGLIDKLKSVLIIVAVILLIIFGIKAIIITRKNDRKEELEQRRHRTDQEPFKPIEQPKNRERIIMTCYKCPNCGATIPSKTTTGEITTNCVFCGGRLPEADKYVDMEVVRHQQQMDYEMQMSARDQQMRQSEKHEFRTKIIRHFPELFIFALIMLFAIVVLAKVNSH